jgi:predicted DNA-binding transcriptional regulator AlpA
MVSTSSAPQHEEPVNTRDRRFGMSPMYRPAKEMAHLLSIPVSSFYKYVKEGRLPEGRKLGRNKIWRVDAVLAAVEGLGHSNDEVDRGKHQATHSCTPQPQQAREAALLLPLSSRKARRRPPDTSSGQSAFAGVLGRT